MRGDPIKIGINMSGLIPWSLSVAAYHTHGLQQALLAPERATTFTWHHGADTLQTVYRRPQDEGRR